MKVCTDACLFGAFVAEWLQSHQVIVRRALDIGAGTGLLSLMIAQKSDALIDAIELDQPAAEQASENFTASPWSSRLNVLHSDAADYSADEAYDCIVSNPPFFEDDLRSSDQGKNAAKHDTGLTLDQLARSVDRNLAASGTFAVLLPYHRVERFIKIARLHNLHLSHQVFVRHTAAHAFFRGILLFQRTDMEATKAELVIKNGESYSDSFSALLNAYYLHL